MIKKRASQQNKSGSTGNSTPILVTSVPLLHIQSNKYNCHQFFTLIIIITSEPGSLFLEIMRWIVASLSFVGIEFTFHIFILLTYLVLLENTINGLRVITELLCTGNVLSMCFEPVLSRYMYIQRMGKRLGSVRVRCSKLGRHAWNANFVVCEPGIQDCLGA